MNNENRHEELTRSQPQQQPSARVSTAGRFARRVTVSCLLSPGENWWATVFLTYAPQALWLVPAVLALLVTLICRERFLSFVATVLVAFVLVVLMGWQWRTSAPPLECAQRLAECQTRPHVAGRNRRRHRADPGGN